MSKEDVRKWILIVDDDSSVRQMLGRVLFNEGFGILTAANGNDAISLASTMSFDLVLLDLNMAGINGWETLEEFKENHVNSPVIVITALPNQHGAAEAAGVAALLEKPLDFPSLIQTVRQVLSSTANLNNPT